MLWFSSYAKWSVLAPLKGEKAMLRFVFVGKTKEKALTELCCEFTTRLSRFTKIEIITLKEEKDASKEKIIAKEGDAILHTIKENSYCIALDERGKMMSSIAFASFLEKEELKAPIVFCVGGTYGLSDAVRARANMLLAFSHMTFTHEMIRLFLLEQVYRAYCIRKNIPYHK